MLEKWNRNERNEKFLNLRLKFSSFKFWRSFSHHNFASFFNSDSFNSFNRFRSLLFLKMFRQIFLDLFARSCFDFSSFFAILHLNTCVHWFCFFHQFAFLKSNRDINAYIFVCFKYSNRYAENFKIQDFFRLSLNRLFIVLAKKHCDFHYFFRKLQHFLISKFCFELNFTIRRF